LNVYMYFQENTLSRKNKALKDMHDAN